MKRKELQKIKKLLHNKRNGLQTKDQSGRKYLPATHQAKD
jgi:hypothetical protein